MKRLITLFLAMLLLPTLAFASKLPVQGHLSNGGASMDGDHQMVFTFYTDSLAGTSLWTETRTVHVQGTLFTCVLGQANPLPDNLFSNTAWLEINVDGTVLAPRTGYYPQPIPTGTDNLWSTDGTNVWRTTGGIGMGIVPPDPGYRLTIDGNDGQNVSFSNNTHSKWDVGAFSDNSFRINETGVYPRLVMKAGGAIGFSTDIPDQLAAFSDHPLVISGQRPSLTLNTTSPNGLSTLQFKGPTTGSQFHLNFADGSPPALSLYSYNSGSYIMSILGNGNLGINTTSPTEKLHVENGRILVTGNGADDTAKLYFINRVAGENRGWGWQALDNGSFELEEFGVANSRITVAPGGNVTLTGNLVVNGTKCRNADGVLMNAVESGHASFTDDNQSVRLVNGRARIDLSPRFMKTVTVNGQYKLLVTVTFYGPHGGDWYVQRDDTGFTVIDPSGSNAEFSWEVKARQKGYEDTYLESANK